MFIDERLPINKDYLLEQDRTLSFSGMTWEDYEEFSTAEYLGYRTSFLNGVITLMSPSQNHEIVKDFIFLLVITYCDAFEIDYYPTGSTTYKNKDKQVGKEPDTSFCFNSLKDIPDLAIEVVFSGETPRRRKTQGNAHQESSGSTNDLQKYQKLGVKEVWFWIDNTLQIYILVDDIYQQQENSFNLSKIEAKLLGKYIDRALVENPRVLKRNFINEIK